ncbi:juvenile hormone epoxide hydrolase 1-like [Sitophilus oryzae]|uniref:Epoxide hydrolase n=1 Tax=Sitophilus oryzae TaxID=7048 RepID=A0A6J2YRY9_SITOR|nr:juvenile hormone epoxide hydrolase 1-like [Sitophilus oryzae]
MGSVGRFVAFSGLLVIAYFFLKSSKIPPVPTIEETWWGPGSPKKEDATIKPFKINVPDEVIADLENRLNTALPFQEPLEDAKQHYGINTKLLTTIVDYWKTKYNWKKRQEFLNQFPQYQTQIQGLNIHFLHVKPKNVPQGVEVLPLLLLHGWPGSVREFYEIIPILTTPQKGKDFVFEVIAPSLPGYGFSDGASKQGLHAGVMGQIFDKLMRRLKFSKYYLQGGDWGSLIAQDMSVLYADRVIGVHSNMCNTQNALGNLQLFVGAWFPSLALDKTEAERNTPLSSFYGNILLESGYMHLQATKPDTVGVALSDSPVGLAAYIIEKFTTWTNPAWKDLEDGGLTKKYTLDKLLDNVMIYWVSRSITTSVRLYLENFSATRRNLDLDSIPITVPSGCSRFKHELIYPIKAVLKGRYKQLISVDDHDDGGHFAAFELPEVLAKDVFNFVQKVRALPKQKQEL